MERWYWLLIVIAGLPGCVGYMLPGKLVSLNDGEIYSFEIEKSHGSGEMTAVNSRTGETFTGRYTAIFHGGGITQLSAFDSQANQLGTVSGFTIPSDTTARGYLRGDEGTVIDIYLEIDPGISPTGHGVGIDNKGNRYQIQF